MSNFHRHTMPQNTKEIFDQKTNDTQEGLLCYKSDEEYSLKYYIKSKRR